MMYMYLQKVINQKNFCILKVTDERAGSGSVAGSGLVVSQRYGSENPDPFQNVADPDDCRGQFPFFRFLSGVKGTGQLERMKAHQN